MKKLNFSSSLLGLAVFFACTILASTEAQAGLCRDTCRGSSAQPDTACELANMLKTR